MLYKDQIDKNRIPAHIAIIMDGNGRWAKQQGHARTFGHQAGAETVHVIAEEAARLGVKYLTLYTFSTENWNRPVDEVAALMSLLMDSIEEETFMKNNISFRIIGKVAVKLRKRNAMKAQNVTDKQEAKERGLGEAPGEVIAAISMALHEAQGADHDVEETILTISRVKRSYSPWSSKIYTLRETPHKK